jgi:hypothetical protein
MVQWHECGARTLLNILGSGGKSFICLNQNGSYAWSEINWLREVAIIIAVAFVAIPLLRRTFGKKKRSRR